MYVRRARNGIRRPVRLPWHLCHFSSEPASQSNIHLGTVQPAVRALAQLPLAMAAQAWPAGTGAGRDTSHVASNVTRWALVTGELGFAGERLNPNLPCYIWQPPWGTGIARANSKPCEVAKCVSPLCGCSAEPIRYCVTRLSKRQRKCFMCAPGLAELRSVC